MTYSQALEYIHSFRPFVPNPELDRLLPLLNALGNPQDQLKFIHVAGTNGKGSTVTMCAKILTLSGYRCGVFTSPYVVDFRERFQVDGEMISQQELAALVEALRPILEEMKTRNQFVNEFDVVTAIGFLYFLSKGCNIVCLEVGLGGIHDSTNVIKTPLAEIITSISLDHTRVLGDTIEEIAAKKAGIIKPGVPVIYDGSSPEAEKVILARAKELGSPAYPVYPSMCEVFLKSDKSIDFYLNCGYYEHTAVEVPYLADYQMMNSSLALVALDTIDKDHEISLKTRLAGIRKTRWQGRMETVMPGVVLDGAHNAAGVKEFVRTVKEIEGSRRAVMLFAAVVEKNFETMIETICHETNLSAVVATEIKGDRNVPAEDLAAIFRKYTDAPVTAVSGISDAFKEALKEKEDGMLFCVGSLYLVGELKAILAERKKKES